MNLDHDIMNCMLCPRECGADRTKGVGYCGGGEHIRAAKAYLHKWEEPCICGKNGAGTVFFSGCSLKCVYCQNYRISSENFGKDISCERLSEIFLELAEQGAACIDLVGGTQYIPHIVSALDRVKHRLDIPVVFNSGGYEKTETLEMLRGYVDIFLPDIKYFSSDISEKYSGAADYFVYASRAVMKMCEIAGECRYDGDALKKGTVIRHMVLPGQRRDSERILHWVAEALPRGDFIISIMSQYTPFYRSSEFKEIDRRVFSYEYDKVLETARSLGLDGYMQERSSAKEEYTPDFDLYGI